MPNWCNNRLTVEGDEKELMEFIKQAHQDVTDCNDGSEESSVLSFDNLVPIPEGLHDHPYDPHGYFGRRILWGVKWGASEADLIDHDDEWAEYEFSTPWGPPLPFLIRVSERFPKLSFHLDYEERNCDLVGRASFKTGQVTRLAVLEDMPIGNDDDAKAITRDILEEQLSVLARDKSAEDFGDVEMRKEFVKELDPSLAAAV